MMRSRSFASPSALVPPFATPSPAAPSAEDWRRWSNTHRDGCPHKTIVDVQMPNAFGKAAHGTCQRCKTPVPIAATVLLTHQSDPALNGPWKISPDGAWTRPTEDGSAAAIVERASATPCADCGEPPDHWTHDPDCGWAGFCHYTTERTTPETIARSNRALEGWFR